MYDHFTDRARKVMQLANQEALRFNHEYIGTEHVLLGLIKEGSGVAAHVLKNLDMDLRKIRQEVERLVQSGPDLEIKGKLPQTPRAKTVIKYAVEEARHLNHDYVGTEHILLGLLREDEGVAAQVLTNLGLKLEWVREEVLNLVRGAGETSERSQPNESHATEASMYVYERFTDRARKVMQLANREAQRFNHEYIGSEHILLGLIEEGGGVAAHVLKNLDVDLSKARHEVEKLVQSGPDKVPMVKLPQMPGAKKVIEYTMEEARKLNHNYVGTEHILLGLLRHQEGVAAEVFKNLGLQLDNVREMVLNLLDDGTQQSEVGERGAARGPLPATRINVAESRSEVGERGAARGAFFWSVAVLVLSLIALAGSLLLSIGLGLKACPLCFYQRSFVMGIFAVQAIGLVAGRAKGGFLCLLSLPLAAAGLGVAAFHEYLVLNGTLECPGGLFELGTAPAQSLAAFIVLSVVTALGAWAARSEHRSRRLRTALAAAGLGLVLAGLSIASAPPLPPPPAAPYDPVKQPLDTCRPPFVPRR